ncbi:hypothetical protein BTR23_11795 [Alkalihalophilus pseudofirmus]|nr:hypothetical protein BTR23_11795 [Alkalihalophilus pseudofirmus]
MVTACLPNDTTRETVDREKQQEKKEASTTQISAETATKENKPVSWNTGVATTDFMPPLENSSPRTTDVTHVMLHFMSNGANKPDDAFNMNDIRSIFIDYGVSAHYVIDRKGQIYRLLGEDRVAFHAGSGNIPGYPKYKDNMNDYSIGIELLAIGTREEMVAMIPGFPYDQVASDDIGYTSAQYNALNSLLNDIYIRYPTISKSRKHVIGHDEYAPGRKTDPGSLFDWSRIGF